MDVEWPLQTMDEDKEKEVKEELHIVKKILKKVDKNM